MLNRLHYNFRILLTMDPFQLQWVTLQICIMHSGYTCLIADHPTLRLTQVSYTRFELQEIGDYRLSHCDTVSNETSTCFGEIIFLFWFRCLQVACLNTTMGRMKISNVRWNFDKSFVYMTFLLDLSLFVYRWYILMVIHRSCSRIVLANLSFLQNKFSPTFLIQSPWNQVL